MYNSVKIIKTVACCKFGDPYAYFIKSFFFSKKDIIGTLKAQHINCIVWLIKDQLNALTIWSEWFGCLKKSLQISLNLLPIFIEQNFRLFLQNID